MNAYARKCLVIGVAVSLSAQTAKLEFEVASVRALGPVEGGAAQAARITGGPGTNDFERITYSHVPMQQLIVTAYDVGRDQISGPDWATTDDVRHADRFDITAKVPAGATKEQVAGMLQNLLAERFHLTLHRVTKEFSGYALVVAKGGAKLRESAGPPADSERASPVAGKAELAQDGFPPLFPGLNMGMWANASETRNRFRDYPLSGLVNQLTLILHAHVVDETGLTGKYDFTLQFELPPNGMLPMLPLFPGQLVSLTAGPPTPAQQDEVATVSAAMEKQLGLKLEAAKVPLEVLVIDHIEKNPSEN
jgi:uncharacterized protein (TIGR03435 family)